ncbi:MAG TPA: response regulator transcription factor [Polyangiaceae bacterium]|nr:response regulator transcription factor [Polyangiaceae bacterium]
MTERLILIVEDEAVVRRVLTLALQSRGYLVAQAETGRQALERIRAGKPDAMILDLGLPDMDGIDVAAIAHREHQVPIIVLSGRGEEQQQIRALDAGADDYVTKPFREGELMARLRATLRRAPLAVRDELSIGDLKLDVYGRAVTCGSQPVSLTPLEFKLLQVLAEARGRVVTHERLLTEVWGSEHANELAYLRVYMKQLRRKLEDDPAQPKRLLTILGVGYRLVPADLRRD